MLSTLSRDLASSTACATSACPLWLWASAWYTFLPPPLSPCDRMPSDDVISWHCCRNRQGRIGALSSGVATFEPIVLGVVVTSLNEVKYRCGMISHLIH